MSNESTLKKNRSIPESSVIPVLYYPDVRQAVEWLSSVIGLVERLRIGDHRCQLLFGNGALVLAGAPSPGSETGNAQPAMPSVSVMLRVTDIDDLFRRAEAAGARVGAPPANHPYGERQCSFADPWGHLWTLSETIADSNPADWGGELLGQAPQGKHHV